MQLELEIFKKKFNFQSYCACLFSLVFLERKIF